MSTCASGSLKLAYKRSAPVAKTHSHHELALPSRGVIRIAVISDTHSVVHPEARKLVEDAEPDIILHAGDIGKREVLEPFEEIAPTYVVRGNIDSRSNDPDVVTLTIGDASYCLRIVMTHIALYGPRLRKDARELAQRHGSNLLVCGHSHVPFIGQQHGIALFNPGSIGPRRSPLPISFGLMEFGPGHSRLRHVDCETGETWLP